MKRFSFISSVLILLVVMTFLFIGCQKEQTDALTEVEATSSETVKIVEVNGNERISGMISEQHAREMAEDFAKKFPLVKTTSVVYSTKDLITFLSILAKKYNSDSVSVSFGVYNKANAPRDSYVGRTTMFFMGKNKKFLETGQSSNVKSQGSDNDRSSNYLNGGHLVPPPPSSF